MTQDVFNNTPDQGTTNAPLTTEANVAPNPLVSQLVGNGKKFKDVEALAKGKLEADAFIAKVQEENAGLRAELDARLKAEESVATLNRQRNQNHGSDEGNNAPELSKDAIASIVREELSNVSVEETAKNNVKEANNFIIGKLGGQEQAVKFLEAKAAELGVQLAWLKDMAARSPKALYNVLGLDTQQQQPNKAPQGVMKGDVNPQSLRKINGDSNQSVKAHYDEMRKANPSAYWSAAVQNEIFAAMKSGTYK